MLSYTGVNCLHTIATKAQNEHHHPEENTLMKKLTHQKMNIIFVLVIGFICLVLIFKPTGFEKPEMFQHSFREKGEIISVDNSDLDGYGAVTVGTQDLVVHVLQGPFKGDTLRASNILMGDLRLDKIFLPNDKVQLVLKTNKTDDKIITARADDLYRINVELILFGLFALFLLAFAKWTGFKALLSFVFTALIFWKILLPSLLKGIAPIPLSLAIVAITTSVIILLISGFTKKGLVALSGSIVGVIITCSLALLFGHFFRIPGTVMDYAETLRYIGFEDINLSDMFLSAIFISAAGAVMDVAMDIAAAQNELMEKRPDMKLNELVKSGFSIAYPVIGTMTTTLLFAYSGSFLFMFMVFMSKGNPMEQIVNINYMASEILYTLVGSFGLVLVAPATAIIGGYIYTKTRVKS